MIKRDIHQIPLNYLLNYNQMINKLKVETDGPIAVKTLSELTYRQVHPDDPK